MTRRVVALLAGAAMLGACGGGSSPHVRRPVPRTTVSTASPTIPSSGGPSVTVGIICSVPTDAAQALVSAWRASDPAAAGRCASPAAVATLFGRSGQGAAWTFQGCDGPDPGVPQCVYAYPGGHATFTVTGTEAQGWKVDRVAFGL